MNWLRSAYTAPFRVYLCLGLLAAIGIFAGVDLPISLFPNSNKPSIEAGMPYGGVTAKEFLDNYGWRIENQLKSISTSRLKVENVEAHYNQNSVYYKVEFDWGTEPKEALREIDSTLNSLSSRWPKEVRDGLWTNFWSKSSGFIAISFFSEKRSIDELYDILDPEFSPLLAKVSEAQDANLWNPNQKQVRLTLKPEVLSSLGLFPRHIKSALDKSLNAYTGGNVQMGPKNISVMMPRNVKTEEDLSLIPVTTPSGGMVHLGKVANIEIGPSQNSTRIFKTNGAKSLILFANPKTGGNVKKMAEDILKIVDEVMPLVPKDIQYRVLVDPSEFIRQAVNNVLHEVFLAAGLAVLVLFLFIGSFKNTITAAIEIPLSMVLAFIMMKLTDMNINLISLGGLALSAGMNVDASVVVMENIFRYMENVDRKLNAKERLQLIVKAVSEVSLPVIGATIASLVVFLPLAMTKDLTNAILGDLAKAVVFSHGFSAFVALILVPTIRLQLMQKASDKGGNEQLPKSPIEPQIKKTEELYGKALENFLKAPKLKWLAYAGTIGLLSLSLLMFLPKLKKEIVGTPDTDWIILGINTSGNSLIKQMEVTTDKIEAEMLKNFGDKIKYTFVQVRRPNRSNIMARLKNKKDMDVIWKGFQEHFTNTPETSYWVIPWNPAELPIPDPPDMEVHVKGGDVEDRQLVTRLLKRRLQEKDVFPQISSNPDSTLKKSIYLDVYEERWPILRKMGLNIDPYDLADSVRVATTGKSLGSITIDEKSMDIQLKFPEAWIKTKEDIAGLPIKVGKKWLPLSALADVKYLKAEPKYFRENGRNLSIIHGRMNKGDDHKVPAALEQAKNIVKEFKETFKQDYGLKSTPSIIMEDAKVELNNALDQLLVAVSLSIALIFVVLLFQFGSPIHTLIVLTAVPLGIMGVIISLYVFNSTLSLNSALGVILLNGIAVANSIILVDFIKRLVEQGLTPEIAAVEACKKRLRPILITSLTTILGMLPIAVGMGEGGKILQPLGIAVAGGLWVSMLFTLFIVPSLEVTYFRFLLKRDPKLLENALRYQEKDLAVELEPTPDLPMDLEKHDEDRPWA